MKLETMTRAQVLDSLGLIAFAAWCNTSPELASTRKLWGERFGRLTMTQWDRVSERLIEHLATTEGRASALGLMARRVASWRLAAICGTLAGLLLGAAL